MSTITTLIPAYKSQHLGELFLGLKTQTFRDFRVVLSDDSPGGAITDLIRRGAYDALIDAIDLVVVPGPRQGSFRNVRHLLREWGATSPLVHLHMDDDVIYPDFYRLHAMTHASARVGASVSQRWLTSADGRPVAHLPLPDFIEQQGQRIVAVDRPVLYASTIAVCQNWLGECSNAVLSQAAARRLQSGRINGLSYYGLGDIGVLIDVAQESPIAFLHDHLSGFRSHPAQATARVASHALRCGHLAWVALAVATFEAGLLPEAQARQAITIATQRCRQVYAADPAFAEYFELVQRAGDSPARLAAPFRALWTRWIESDAESRSDDQPHPLAEVA